MREMLGLDPGGVGVATPGGGVAKRDFRCAAVVQHLPWNALTSHQLASFIRSYGVDFIGVAHCALRWF